LAKHTRPSPSGPGLRFLTGRSTRIRHVSPP
jgi:hypothetical protein